MMRALTLAVVACLLAWPSRANDLDVDLSKPDVRLDVSFEGADLLLFGAKDQKGDVIVVVRGPETPTSVRLKDRIGGIWVNTDEVIFEDAPAYYAVAATKPLDDILPAQDLERLKIGTPHLNLTATAAPEGAQDATIKAFRDGLVRNMVRKNLYGSDTGEIRLVGKQLFRTELWFPANVSVGDYTIDTYLVRDGRIEKQKTTLLDVHKVGLEAQVYNFAHDHALVYGLLAIVVAVVSGWTANAVFRKRA